MRGAVKLSLLVWAMAVVIVIGFGERVSTIDNPVTDAPAAFDSRPRVPGVALKSLNGFAEEFCDGNQVLAEESALSPRIDADECSFDTSVEEFTGPETVADGLGPVFNAAGCGECHMMPVLGGSSQITERRAGFFNGSIFIDHPGGSLIQDRANHPSIQETTFPANTNVQAFRSSLNLLGDGFVEAISNSTLEKIRDDQPFSKRGTLVSVPVLERPGQTRFGRFGHKAQQASLLSFSADAYVNEMGITSPMQPDENTHNGNSIAAFDTVADPDDDGVDVALFALFMRSTAAPPQAVLSDDAKTGRVLFEQIGCAVCHTKEIITAAPGTSINGGALRVAKALGNKRIKPFSDFLLHDIGTGDGIVQNGGQGTRNKVRTAALWGLRTRGRLMHDALTFNVYDAIQRHDNQADSARDNFNALRSFDRKKVLVFLNSL